MLAGRSSPRGRRQAHRRRTGRTYHSELAGKLADGGVDQRRRRAGAPRARRRRRRAAAGARPRARASRGASPTCTWRRRSLFYLLFAFGPLVYTAWLSFFDWDGLTVGTWVGLDNYNEVLSDPDIRASFVHSFELIFFYAVLPVRPRADARVADRAQPRARRDVLPRRAVPAADDRHGRRRARVGVDLRAGRAAQRGAARDRPRQHRARLARRLHLRAARARPGRHVGDVRPLPRAVPGRHPEDPASRSTRPRAWTARAACASSSRSRCRACAASWRWR